MLATDLRLALDPVAFARERLGIEPDKWQAHALRWPGKRLLLNCSRQSGKSTIASVIALHRALFHPGSLVLLVSPSLRQSSELFRKISDLMKTLDVRPQLVEDNRLSCRLENGSRVLSLPGSEKTIRGFSAPDLIIEDEAARVEDDLYGTMRPMLAVSGGALILMSTPYGKIGHFYTEWSQGGPSWERIQVKAPDCQRIDPKFLEEERAAHSERWFLQEYQCEFVEREDEVFGYDLIMQAISSDVKPLFGGRSDG